MDFLANLKLSQTTLIFFFIVPFSYYAYHAKYWYRPDLLQMLDFMLKCFCVLLCAVAMSKLYQVYGTRDRVLIEITLLHLGPPVLALMNASKRRVSGFGQPAAQARGGGAAEGAGSPDFKPVPINKGERLTWEDLIIEDSLKQELMSVIDLLKDTKTAKKYGIAVPKGILLNGPPGTGKTTIARVIAQNSNLSFFILKADEIVSKWVGESEKNLTAFFEACQKHSPAVIFMDEIDSIGKSRAEGNAAHSDNLLNHLLQLIDGCVASEGLYIIAATNRADLVDEALKRAGRLNRVIEIPLPNKEARKKLFQLYSKKLNLEPGVDLDALAEVTNKLPAAAIKEICNQAGLLSFKRESTLGKREFLVKVEDIEMALSQFVDEDAQGDDEEDDSKKKKKGGEFQPVEQGVAKVGWNDLIIGDDIKKELQSVITLLKDPQTAKNYGIDVPKGILLNGPPGTGKTTVARVIANESGCSFFVMQANDIVSKWVGESEKNLTKLFKAAVKHAPSIIFMDEIDSIGKSRGSSSGSSGDNLLNHMLQLIDGVIKRDGIYVIAATNRADLVDSALKRGGRLNKVIEIPLPDFQARKAIFQLYMKRLRLSEDIDLDALSEYSEGKSASDIKEICNQAGLNAFKRESALGSREYIVQPCDLEAALAEFMQAQNMHYG
jgi:transitional endoplasmic reticulum ATPase